jgi:hypothetical protein
MPDEDEEVQAVTDRNYWETVHGTKETVALVDEMLDRIKTFAPDLELKYNQFYIGLAKDGQPNNSALFRARRSSFTVLPPTFGLRRPQTSTSSLKRQASKLWTTTRNGAGTASDSARTTSRCTLICCLGFLSCHMVSIQTPQASGCWLK